MYLFLICSAIHNSCMYSLIYIIIYPTIQQLIPTFIQISFHSFMESHNL